MVGEGITLQSMFSLVWHFKQRQLVGKLWPVEVKGNCVDLHLMQLGNKPKNQLLCFKGQPLHVSWFRNGLNPAFLNLNKICC